MHKTALGLIVLLVCVVCAESAAAQDSPASYYAFAGAGSAFSTFRNSSNALFHVGGGGEFAANNGLGFGAEGGYLGPWSNGSNGVAVVSLNGLYRFARADTQPFVTGGYSLGFRSTAASFGNVGGGVTIWTRPGLGIRLELRDNIRDAATHWVTARVGIAWR